MVTLSPKCAKRSEHLARIAQLKNELQRAKVNLETISKVLDDDESSYTFNNISDTLSIMKDVKKELINDKEAFSLQNQELLCQEWVRQDFEKDQQIIVKNLTEQLEKSIAKNGDLSKQLQESQRTSELLKKARGNANRILDVKLQELNSKLFIMANQNHELSWELVRLRTSLQSADDENAYLRNRLAIMSNVKDMEIKRLTNLLEESNNRKSERKIRDLENLVQEQLDNFRMIKVENERLLNSIDSTPTQAKPFHMCKRRYNEEQSGLKKRSKY